jgi:hypothetical protein
VIRLAMADYEEAYGTEESRLEQLRQLLSVALPASTNGKDKAKPKAKAKTGSKHHRK